MSAPLLNKIFNVCLSYDEFDVDEAAPSFLIIDRDDEEDIDIEV